METLTVTLKQHTPLIHFQHSHEGATLRASEVKPKLDRFILKKLGKGDYCAGVNEAKKKNWLIGKGEHPALDYKMRIMSREKVEEIHLTSCCDNEKKWTAEKFPLLLSNMDKKESEDELVNLVMHKSNSMYLYCRDNGLYKKLKELIPYFMENTNFGQRSNKGFGSFTVQSVKDNYKEIKLSGNYIEGNPCYMDFCLWKGSNDDNVRDRVYSLSVQKKLFSVIERFWNDLRKKVDEDASVAYDEKIDSIESYIKGMKKLSLNRKDVCRLPAPIMFKPILYTTEEKGGNKILGCNIYIMFDPDFMQRLKNECPDQINISNSILKVNDVFELKYVEDFIMGLLYGKDQDWRVKIKKEMIKINFFEENGGE